MAFTKVTSTLADTLNQNTTGSAATLTNARTIGGTSFDGSANIAVALAAVATEATNITASANNSADETVYPTFVDGATGTQGLETDTGLTYNPSSGNLTTSGQLGGATLNLSGNATVGGNLTVTGTSTVVNTVTMNAQNAIVFEGATADNYETTLSIVDPTADHTQYLINQGGYIPVLAAATTTAISATPAELNILDGVTSTAAELNLLDGSVANTVVNSKGVIYGGSGQVAGTLSTAAQTAITSLGTLTALTVSGNTQAASFTAGTANANSELLYLLGSGHTGHGASNTVSLVSIAESTSGNIMGLWIGSMTNENTGVIGTRTATGNIAFQTHSGGWGERMRITYDGKVGIGTASPSTKLDLYDGSSNAAVQMAFENDAREWRMGVHGGISDSFTIYDVTADATRFVIDTSGKVGIGTATPNRTLSITTGLAKTSTTAAYPFAIQSNEASGNAQLSVHAIGGASAAVRKWLIQTEEAGVANDGNIQMQVHGGGASVGSGIPSSHHSKSNKFIVGSGGATGMSVFNGTAEGWYAFSRSNANNTDAYDGGMSYNGDRNLGFHTNAGARRMQIDADGTIQFGDPAVGGAANVVVMPQGKLFLDAGGHTYIQESSDNVVDHYTGGARRMRLNSEGGSFDKIRVGALSPALNGLLTVEESNAGLPVIWAQNTATDSVGIRSQVNSTAASNYIYAAYNSGGIKWKIRNDGDHQGSDTSIGSISDSRTKKDVADLTYDITKFKQYRPIEFNWINPECHNHKSNNRGFIAQEVKAIDDFYTDKYEASGDDIPLVDEDGKAHSTKFGYKDAMYISVIKQLITRLETAEAKIAVLEG